MQSCITFETQYKKNLSQALIGNHTTTTHLNLWSYCDWPLERDNFPIQGLHGHNGLTSIIKHNTVYPCEEFLQVRLNH